MRNVLILLLLSFGLFTQQTCQPPRTAVEVEESPAPIAESGDLTVAFYNVENLFDIEDDPLTDDQQFLPNGEKQWTADRFQTKIEHLGKVLSSMAADLPDVIGLCEIENRSVLEALAASEALKAANYKIVHKNSPDKRGIDCALLYNPARIEMERLEFYTVKLPVKDKKTTRDIVYAQGVSEGDTLHFFVNHWPSRGGGQELTEPRRLQAAYTLKKKVDAIQTVNPDARILIMGDFNDYPQNKSISELLGAGISDRSRLFNYMSELHKSGKGTYNYKGDWGTLDQFIGTWSLVNADNGFAAERGSAEIFREEWMMYTNKEGETYPSRTYGGPNYYGGYSDHLPILITLEQH